MVRHKKQSVVDDTASTAEIKGADWNAEHCYGAGSLVPIGLMVVSFDAAGFVAAAGFGAVSASTRVDAGSYTASLEVLSPDAVANGCDIAHAGVVSISPLPAALSSLLISSAIDAGAGSMSLTITDVALAGVDPTVMTSICVTVYASITVSPPPPA